MSMENIILILEIIENKIKKTIKKTNAADSSSWQYSTRSSKYTISKKSVRKNLLLLSPLGPICKIESIVFIDDAENVSGISVNGKVAMYYFDSTLFSEIAQDIDSPGDGCILETIESKIISFTKNGGNGNGGVVIRSGTFCLDPKGEDNGI